MAPFRRQAGRLALALLFALPWPVAASVSEQPQWKRYFEQFKAEGTVVVFDGRGGAATEMIFHRDRAQKRLSPASTFKIPHALFALDAGVVGDEFEIIRWDGRERSIPAWNQDQTLRSAMPHSVVWVFERFAEKIGEEKEGAYLKKIRYGNEKAGGGNPFWLKGELKISAREQIAFLRKLHANTLPFEAEHQRIVKKVMMMEAGEDWVLRGKTGWNGSIGWWVGWVECATGSVFFALNIDTPRRADDLPKREGIMRAILASLNALPAPGNEERPDQAAPAPAQGKPESSETLKKP